MLSRENNKLLFSSSSSLFLPVLRTCSSDTILRMMKELSCDNITYTSDTGTGCLSFCEKIIMTESNCSSSLNN